MYCSKLKNMKKHLKITAFRIMNVFLLSTLLQLIFIGELFASEMNIEKIPIVNSITQQGITITGQVTSQEDGLAIPGVNIIVKGSTNGTVTDFDGNYTIVVSDENAILVFSSIGFIEKEVLVGNKSVINVIMSNDVTALDEVVIIGYGSQKIKEVTGSVSSVTAKDINKLQVAGLDQALQGQMAGVQVTQNSGEPGGGVSIRIRGPGSINSLSEPLYVIDGVPYGDLNSINPNDIARIDVLKDAATAAIYGSRASNGVIIVTTKLGIKGKVVVDFDAYTGLQSIYKKLDLLNGSQFAKLANENLVNSGLDINPAWSNPESVPNTDWQDAILQTAVIQSYNVSVSGGGEKSSNRISFGYFDQEGIIIGSGYERYTARLNSDFNVSDNLKVGVRLNTSFSKNNRVSTSDAYGGVLENASYSQPTTPIYSNQDGLFGINTVGGIDPNGNTYYGWNGHTFISRFAEGNLYPAGVSNVLYATKDYKHSEQNSHSTLMSAFVDWEVIPGLNLKSTFNYTFNNGFNTSGIGAAPYEMDQRGAYSVISKYNETWLKFNQLNWINSISYKKSFNDHNIDVLAGVDALKSHYQGVYINTINVPDDQRVIDASDPDRTVFGHPTDESLLSYFGRISYNYAEKYLITAVVRRDGSSKFGPYSQWATFPSVSLGWRISEESFMDSADWFDELKIRASYGEVGNQNIPNFKYLNTFSSDYGWAGYDYTLGNNKNIVNAIRADNVGVPDIHWEKSIMKDIGIDAQMFNHKISLTLGYYIKTLDDLLGEFPVPQYTGVPGGSILKNGFTMENKGFEIALGYNESIGDFNFSINGNFSTLDNKVLKLTDNVNGYITQPISQYNLTNVNDGSAHTRTSVGETIATYYGYVTNGIAQTQADIDNSGMTGIELGDRLYKDMDGNGLIDAEDRVALGNGLPKYNFGLTLKADWKGFDFSVLFSGQADVDIANTVKFTRYNMRHYGGNGLVNVSTDLLNSWTGPGTTNELPRNAYLAPTSNRWFSDFNIEDGTYVRINNIQFGYTFPEEVSSRGGMSMARIYISAQNLYTWTNYSGYDPEVGSFNQNVLMAGVDFGRYPASKMFSLGVKFKF
jgi:TonB-linked SusC/RagA family outer membrane protein